MKGIIIFGAGIKGKTAYRHCIYSKNFKFVCYADDSEAKQLKGVDGQTVLSIEKAINKCKTDNIVPVIAEENYKNLHQRLTNAGMKPILFWYKSNLGIAIKYKHFLNRLTKIIERSHKIIKLLLFPVAVILYLLGYRVAENFLFRGFGHIAMEPAAALANPEWQNYKIILIIDDTISPNNFLQSLWKKHFIIIRGKFKFHLLYPLQTFHFLSVNFSLNRSRHTDRYLLLQDDNSQKNIEKIVTEAYLKHFPRAYRDIISYLEKNRYEPFLKFPDLYGESCKRMLKKHLAITEDDQFVLFHAREDRNYNLQRSNNYDNYKKAKDYLIRNGIKTIRLSDKTEAIPDNEYPAGKIKSKIMDIYLISKATFFISSASGPSAVAMVFGVPQLQTNLTSWFTPPLLPCDLYLFKHFISGNKHIEISKYLERKIFLLNVDDHIDNLQNFSDVMVMENSPDDICDAVIEMLDHPITSESCDTVKEIISLFPSNSCIRISKAGLASSFAEKYYKELTGDLGKGHKTIRQADMES